MRAQNQKTKIGENKKKERVKIGKEKGTKMWQKIRNSKYERIIKKKKKKKREAKIGKEIRKASETKKKCETKIATKEGTNKEQN